MGGALFNTSCQIGAALGQCFAALISSQRAQVVGLHRALRETWFFNMACMGVGRLVDAVCAYWKVPIIVVLLLRDVGKAMQRSADPRQGTERSSPESTIEASEK